MNKVVLSCSICFMMIVLFLGLDARYVPAEPVSFEIRAQRFCDGWDGKLGGYLEISIVK